MAINTRVRLQQITGSIGTGDGQINDATSAVAAGSMNPSDISTVLSHLAAGLKRVHGGSTFSEQTAGKFVGAHDFDSTTFDLDASGALTMDAGAGSHLKTSSGDLDIDAAGELDLDGATVKLDSAGQMDITAVAAMNLVSAAYDVNASGVVGIDSDAAMTLGGQSVDIDADGGTLSLDGSGGINIGVAADVAIDVDASTFDLDASGAITVDGATGNYNMSGRVGLSGSNVEIMAKNSSMVLTGAAGITLQGEGVLSLDGNGGINIGTRTNEAVDFNASTFDLDCSGALTADSTTALFTQSSTFGIDAAGAVTIDSDAGVTLGGQSIDVDADGGTLSLDGSGGINIGVASDVAIDVDSSTFDLDASGAITVDGATGNYNMSGRLGLSGSNVEIMAKNSSMVLTGAAGITLQGEGVLSLDGNGGINIGTRTNEAVDFNASTFDLDCSGALTADSTTALFTQSSTFGIDAVGAVTIDSDAGVTLGGAGVDIDADGSSKVSIDGAGGIDIGVAADVAIDVDASTFDLDASDDITITAGGSSKLVDIDASGKLSLDGAGGIDIGVAANVAVDFNASTFDLDAAGALTIDGSSAGNIAMSSRLGLSGSSLEMMATGGNAVLTGSSFVGFSSHELPTLSSHFGASMIKVANSGEYTAFSNKAAFSGVDSIVGALNALANAGAPMRYDMSVGSSGLAGGQSLDISTSSSQGTVVKSSDTAEASSALSANALPHKVDVYYNGMLLVSGSSSAVSAGSADYRLAGSEALSFAFALTGSDRITVIDRS